MTILISPKSMIAHSDKMTGVVGKESKLIINFLFYNFLRRIHIIMWGTIV